MNQEEILQQKLAIAMVALDKIEIGWSIEANQYGHPEQQAVVPYLVAKEARERIEALDTHGII